MATGSVNKNELLARVYKLKNSVYNNEGKYYNINDLQKSSIDDTLNDILDILGEYSR
jgi:hypothetical protein